MWGKKVSFHSVECVLDTLAKMLQRLPARMIAIKDDTFTVNRQRVLDLCRGIRDRNLNFLWSCDTRVDVLDEEPPPVDHPLRSNSRCVITCHNAWYSEQASRDVYIGAFEQVGRILRGL